MGGLRLKACWQEIISLLSCLKTWRFSRDLSALAVSRFSLFAINPPACGDHTPHSGWGSMGWHGLGWAWNSHPSIPVSYPLQGQIGTYFSLEVCGKILGCVSCLLTHNTLTGRELLRKIACCSSEGTHLPHPQGWYFPPAVCILHGAGGDDYSVSAHCLSVTCWAWNLNVHKHTWFHLLHGPLKDITVPLEL